MSENIRDISISAAELYGAAAMLDIDRLTQIPRPDAPDMNAPAEREWVEEEFDGAVKLLPDIAKMVELCAWPETYCEATIYKAGKQSRYLVYAASGNVLCLHANVDGYDDGYVANLCYTDALVNFFSGEVPAGDLTKETVTMTEAEAAAFISQPECLVRIGFADIVDDEESVSGRNWIAVYADGTLWQVDEGDSVTLRPLDTNALCIELSSILNAKGGI